MSRTPFRHPGMICYLTPVYLLHHSLDSTTFGLVISHSSQTEYEPKSLLSLVRSSMIAQSISHGKSLEHLGHE